MTNTLIVYYSRKGENYCNGEIKNLEKGNTEIVAEMIRDITGGDIFQVNTAQPYPESYRACVGKAVDEYKKGARPELKEYMKNIEQYDIIFVGYPNWCGTMPMAMFTFLEHYDWRGKRIAPFCTNEGSGLGVSERDIKNICKGAEIEKGLSIHGAEASDSRNKVEVWLEELNI